ncbi:fumarylacetoacetate hydrolase family protein [Neobacillus sp. Marseille-QA0830]
MKLLNYKKGSEFYTGVMTGKGILNLQKAAQQFEKYISNSLLDVISQGSISTIKELVNQSDRLDASFFDQPEEVEFLPVVTNPEKILCVGLNYVSHVEEAQIQDVPETPVIFSKFNNAISAHNQVVSLPSDGSQFDYEAELVIVMGKEAKDVTEDEALSYVFGYSAGNDLSVRDLQFRSSQWLIGKSPDGFAPVGPYLVTAEEIDPTNLKIETKVNGEVRQSSNTKYMIFNCATIISYISKYMTLKPGDLIFTGTPEGVILGLPEEERRWLKPGDQMEVIIENIGTLKTTLA